MTSFRSRTRSRTRARTLARSLVMDVSPLRESRPFRDVFLARTVSVFAIGMLTVAIPVQLYEMTGSIAYVGAASATTAVSLLAGFLLGGDWADRYDRGRLILASRGVAAVGFGLLAVNAFVSHPAVWPLFVLGVLDGLTSGISITALTAAVPALVGPDKLVAAGALNALTVRLGSVAAPALGGAVIAAFGVRWNYAIAAAATLAILLPLLRLPGLRPAETSPGNPAVAMFAGVRFVLGEPTVGGLMLVGLLGMLASGVLVAIPAFVDQQLHAGPAVTGLLYSAPAAGAVLSSLTSGWATRANRAGRGVLLATVAAFGLLAVLGTVHEPYLVVVLLVVFGLVTSIDEILRFALIQTYTPDSMLGRVSSLWSAQETSGAAAGALITGFVAAHLPIGRAIVVYGLVGTGLAALFTAVLASLRGAELNRAAHPGRQKIDEEVDQQVGQQLDQQQPDQQQPDQQRLERQVQPG